MAESSDRVTATLANKQRRHSTQWRERMRTHQTIYHSAHLSLPLSLRLSLSPFLSSSLFPSLSLSLLTPFSLSSPATVCVVYYKCLYTIPANVYTLGVGMYTSPSDVPGQGARYKDTESHPILRSCDWMDSYEYTWLQPPFPI